jgi:hypothetical protein
VDNITKPNAAASEAVLMADIGHYKVISVDYRMPPPDRAITLPGDMAIRGHGTHPDFRRASFVQSGAVSRQVL